MRTTKNYSLIPKKELKEKLGFYSKNKPQRKVEISDDYGFSGIFQSMANAAKVCQIPNASTIKYALDRKKDIFRRRSDNKKFDIREILDFDEDPEAESDETKSEHDEIKSEIDDSETDDSETDVSDVEEDKISNFDFESDSEPEAEIVFESDSEPESEPEATILDHHQNQNPNQIENKLYQYILSFLD